MNRFVQILAVCLLTVSGFSQSVSAQIIAKKGEPVSLKIALKDMLQAEGATKLSKLTVNVSDADATALKKKHGIESKGSYTVYKGLDNAGVLIGTVIIVNEQGKEGPLQVLVALRPDGQIYDLGFTIFGEDKGKPALSWSYLRQYVDKSLADPITLGKDIDGVSGATWTSTSVANAVRKGVVIYDKYVKNG